MRRLTLLLACTALLAATAAAQTAPATASEPVLEIHRFNWHEAKGGVLDFREGGAPSLATVKWRQEHAPGRGNYGVMFVLKNVTQKPIKSVNLGIVFRDGATDRVFLTYQMLFDQMIKPGQKQRLTHIVKEGQEPNNFSPAAPNRAFLDYTGLCGGDEWTIVDPKSGKLARVPGADKSLRAYPCYFKPTVTRIDYEDGTFWQP